MQSFRTEIENPIVERDIIDLEKKINAFYNGKIDEEKFRSLRLARGIYGQRQFGVQMIRIKIPYGKINSAQLRRIADVSDEYSRGRLHITTRQDIQIHYVSLDRTPELWAELEKDAITLREACGNTLRNVTASATAGIDPKEPFDVTPYAHATFQYFLRNPVCQELGRKFKISFSSSEEDDALSFIHDLGFIPVLKDGKRGFKVMLGGGLGAQARLADIFYSFLPEGELIPLIEAVLRVFDSYGERKKRSRARLKFLLKEIGLEQFRNKVEAERKVLNNSTFNVDTSTESISNPTSSNGLKLEENNSKDYNIWRTTNVLKQKQTGLFAVGIKVPLGDFYTDKARKLADLIEKYAADELRFTLRQNILIRHVQGAFLPLLYAELKKLGFADPGYNSTVDITACPGTDTCNLGIASSTGLTRELEAVLKNEFPHYLKNKDVTIKISGCMNACGQHTMAHIGFQGMSVKSGSYVAPAIQVLLGGGILGNGKGRIANKVIKIPSKRGPQALRILLNDFKNRGIKNQSFLDYYDHQGERYFYRLLKPLAAVDNLEQADFIDWGNELPYEKAVGVGECAGVVIDLISTLLYDSEEKIEKANEKFEEALFSESIYYAYTSFVNTAKALLLTKGIQGNSQASIINEFDKEFKEEKLTDSNFRALVNRIREEQPGSTFAKDYLSQAVQFLNQAKTYAENTRSDEKA